MDSPAMTFDEVSMERSKSFVKALQELKNLRPHLHSAAEYCEKSYRHSEQKQMVLDNLKDYAVRALVNAVDHLGTVAYKLNDLLEQQTLDASTMELKVSCVHQQIVNWRMYTDKEGLRQQQLLAIIPRHHKHYVLPNSVNKKVHFSPLIQTDARQKNFQATSCLQPSDSPAAKTLSWHLASETKSTFKGSSNEDSKISGKSSMGFELLDKEESARGAPAELFSGSPGSSVAMQAFGVLRREPLDSSKPFRSFDNSRREIVRAPVQSKSILSAFFVKQKSSKLKIGSVS
ncbi:hypothetical protein K2173_025242 [Erythroxylum novogranatense]|uniref:Uncharacterized protein n=1 Tax=Erythroxylum novogranatense TaxID=1862640 RepID=A0AAV8UD86_9ROSI|nr:hypothetical protein K2173_025242 [Erythroxylum novogranatense]